MESLEPVKLLMESYLLYIVFIKKEMIFLFNRYEIYTKLLEEKGRLDQYLYPLVNVGARNNVNITDKEFLEGNILMPPQKEEQTEIVESLEKITNLITLHQRAYYNEKGGLTNVYNDN